MKKPKNRVERIVLEFDRLLYQTMMTIKICKPWQRKDTTHKDTPEYNKGWNDCVKEITKRSVGLKKEMFKVYKNSLLNETKKIKEKTKRVS